MRTIQPNREQVKNEVHSLASVQAELQRQPHILLKLAENSLTVAKSLRDNYFKNTAHFVSDVRRAIHHSQEGTRPDPILNATDVSSTEWADFQEEVVSFIDGGVGRVQISSQVPILLRVGSYSVKVGERRLAERESTEQAAAESALLKLYTEVWLPRAEEGGIGIEKVAAGGRPLQTTLSDKKQAMIHERIVELITSVQPRIFTTLAPTKIVELFRLGEGPPPQLGISTGEVVDGFYSFLGFTRLMTSGVIRRAAAKGVLDGHFGYVSGPKPSLGTEGKFQVALTKVRFKTVVAEDEIDLESGFLMLPQTIPQPAPVGGSEPVTVVPGGESTQPGGGVTLPPGVPPPVGPVPLVKPVGDKAVELTFDADRNQLFTAWNAIANLADLAGKVKVTVRAESENGFDKGKLQNGVLEPLREADLID